MLRIVGAVVVIGALTLSLAACGSKQPTPDPSGVYKRIGSPIACVKALEIANQNLIEGKREAKRHNAYVDWNEPNNHLAAAIVAQNHGDYALCTEQANQVNASAIRNQNYISWENSLK